jgi:serine/threonine protein kinase
MTTGSHIQLETVKEMIASCLGPERVPKKTKIHLDTSDFFRVDYNDVVLLDGHPYLIRNCEREGRFGLDSEPKYWVKRALDLTNGSTKIIKLVFHEQMAARVGDIIFQCVRSPRKEAAILNLVQGHPHFMQGFAIKDTADNLVRVLDFIVGRRFDEYVQQIVTNHEEYYFLSLPSLIDTFAELIQAIAFLHGHGYKHGDIRRDHILREGKSGIFKWIDFDFDYQHKTNMFGYDLFGLGNILIFIVGGGDVTTQQLASEQPAIYTRLGENDLNIIFNNRIANLKKVYPYIDPSLNNILLHFSNGANLFYDDTQQLLLDLRDVSIH